MVTLTGTFTRLDGSPASGTVRVTPSRSPILDSAGRVVISGPQVFPLDKDGKLTVQIPASNDPDLGPAFTYAIDVNLTHASWKISKVWIPHGSATVDLSEIGDYQPVPGVATRVVTIPADGTDGQVLVWDGAGFSWDFPPEGPQGPPGEVTTAALTAALAGKVTGTGMTVRVDTTVGTRVLLDHPDGTIMLHGDTGWRHVTDWLTVPDAWEIPSAPHQFRARRIGGLVTVQAFILRKTAGGPIRETTIATIGTGFRPTGYSVRAGTLIVGDNRYTDPAAITSRSSPTALQIGGYPATTEWTAGLQVQFEVSWTTSDPWPTTLPGTP